MFFFMIIDGHRPQNIFNNDDVSSLQAGSLIRKVSLALIMCKNQIQIPTKRQEDEPRQQNIFNNDDVSSVQVGVSSEKYLEL